MQKPALDTRDYQRITLDNGLRAVLVSDPSTEKEAAAMMVAVGHMSDGDVPGLAHLCEHL